MNTPDAQPLPPDLAPIATRLADEGIPVACIARALKRPSTDVRWSLQLAKASGAIVEMPAEDWPVGSTRKDHIPALLRSSLSEDDLLNGCMKVFKVTRLQGIVLVVLLKRSEVFKETLHQAIENNRQARQAPSANLEPTDPKMVDVVICHLRKKLTPHNLKIETLWARGYFMPTDSRARAVELIRSFDAPKAESTSEQCPAGN